MWHEAYTHMVGSQFDKGTALSRRDINDIRDVSIRFILGDPDVKFALLDPGIPEKINSYPELQADWSVVAPLYWDAVALYRRQLTVPTHVATHTHAQSTQAHTQPTSMISPAARAQARSNALLHDPSPRSTAYAGLSRK